MCVVYSHVRLAILTIPFVNVNNRDFVNASNGARKPRKFGGPGFKPAVTFPPEIGFCR
jgi:hypothetical protein